MCCNTCLKSPADSDGLLELRNHRGGSNGRKRKGGREGGKKRGRERGNVYGNPSFRSSQILLCSVRLQRKQNQDVWVNTCPTFSELDECVHLIDRPPHRTFQKYLEWSRRPKWPPTGTIKTTGSKMRISPFLFHQARLHRQGVTAILSNSACISKAALSVTLGRNLGNEC